MESMAETRWIRSRREPERAEALRNLAAAGGIMGAIAAASCCIVPLVLFGLGIGGAWIGNLTALAPYKPLFVAATAGSLGYGFYLTYRLRNRTCNEGESCSRTLPDRLVKIGMWSATVLVLAAFAFDYVAPILLGTL